MADVFENFRKISLKIYQLHLAKFLSATGLAWEVSKQAYICQRKFKKLERNGQKTKLKIENVNSNKRMSKRLYLSILTKIQHFWG